jgi:uncharacterized membrane protein YgdD (TMEM256/DUF423 family)
MPSDADWFNRLAIVLAGILGAAGTAAAAGASHAGPDSLGDERVLGALALIALANAPALLAFGLLPAKGWLIRAGALVIAAGAILFCADLAARHFWGNALFPMSAPFGGTAIIAGWLIVALAGLVAKRG